MLARTRQFLKRLAIAAGIAGVLALLVAYVVIRGQATLTWSFGATDIELLRPGWLYLVCVAPYFWLVMGESLSDLSVLQQALSVTLRTVLVFGLALALCRPTTVSHNNRTASVLLVDVSESVSDKQLAAAQGYVDQAYADKKPDDKIFVVSFAGKPQLLRPKGSSKTPQALRHTHESKLTNVQAALQLAYGLYPPGYLPRAVVLSDGNQTTGDLVAEAYKAKQFGVKVSWNVFSRNRRKEIRAASLSFPGEIKVGAPFHLTAEIWSTHEEEVSVTLRQDDFPNPLEPRKKVKLQEGINRIRFKTEAKSSGFSNYKLTIQSPKGDAETANNVSVATVPVKGRPRVLFVEGAYNRQPSAAKYLKRALEKENIDVEVRGPRGVPSSVKEMQRYDLLLLSDVPATFLGLRQVAALERYVRDFGGGFIMAGGQDSFGSGGYQGTRIERLLPVRFESEKEVRQPRIALVLVIDRSGSMNGAKIEMAKESARATAEVLQPSDLISVIAFDNRPATIVRLQKASNRLRIATDIARLQSGGGTSILPALVEAHETLASADAKVKHVILLTDGQASYDGIASECDSMRRDLITVSTVGIGEADYNLLRMISERGEGRQHKAKDATDLPKIFLQETQQVQKSSLVEDVVYAHIVKRVEIIEGTGVEKAPYLKGYVSTKPKKMSEVVLISDRGEPLLARWRVGLGQVVAWTSDVKNRWATQWLSWPSYGKFWAQVVRGTMRHKQHESYDLTATVFDGRARVMVDAFSADDRFVNNLETVLKVIDPRDNKVKRTVPMEQTAAGRYEADFPVTRYGAYILKAVHQRDGKTVAESVGSVALPYPAEFLRSTPNEELLRQTAIITGGLNKPAPAKVFAVEKGESVAYHKDLWPYVLLIVAGFFLFDVYLRRIRLFGYRSMKF